MLLKAKGVNLFGYASGIGAADKRCSDGPLVLSQSPYIEFLLNQELPLKWRDIFIHKNEKFQSTIEAVISHNKNLATAIAEVVTNKEFFIALGGDHSSAIGTWNGVHAGLKGQGPFGLIWIDAHMDSHTLETSPSGNIHGMPLACLLGYGVQSLVNLMSNETILQPQHICLIGVRSYEPEEAELLRKLNVKIYFIEEVLSRGLDVVLAEALNIVNNGTIGYGLSLDIDSIDPNDAPGTGFRVAGGINARELCQALARVADDKRLLGVEIAEFNPSNDEEKRTEKLISHLLSAILGLALSP
jgi:arginase